MKNQPFKSTHPNLSSNAFFFGCAVILVLVAFIFTISDVFRSPEISFGSCDMKTDIAKTDSQKAKGLSGRSSIDKNYAMLFPFQNERPYFWMKDMFIPIDIVWVRGNKVVKVDKNLPADDGAITYQPPQAIDWAVEVAANRASECGVGIGSIIQGLRY